MENGNIFKIVTEDSNGKIGFLYATDLYKDNRYTKHFCITFYGFTADMLENYIDNYTYWFYTSKLKVVFKSFNYVANELKIIGYRIEGEKIIYDTRKTALFYSVILIINQYEERLFSGTLKECKEHLAKLSK